MKHKPELEIVVSNTPEAPAAEPPPEQVEMPFAVVNGEPVTQLPRDLYIPPQALEVFLEAFEGPLDLLLYLIRRQNLNILDIPLAEITRQYMQYIDVMTELQLELAGEYMVMAATLAEIKSRMLLPRPKVDLDGNEEDPRAELVRRLQEYERFKRAAESIDALPRMERDVWPTSAELKDRKVVRLLPQITLQEMLLAFKEVVVRSEMFAHHHIQRERLSVRARMGDILSTLEHASFVEFVRLFRPEEGRMGVTVTFVAILELVREGLIEIVQAEPFAPLHVRASGPNRALRIVAGNDARGSGPEQVFADEPAEVGDAGGAGAAGHGSAAGGAVAAAGAAGLADAADFYDDDDDVDDEPLEGVDDVVDEVVVQDVLTGAPAAADEPPAADVDSASIEGSAALAEAASVNAAVESEVGTADVPAVDLAPPSLDELGEGVEPVPAEAENVNSASADEQMMTAGGTSAEGTATPAAEAGAAGTVAAHEITAAFERSFADATPVAGHAGAGGELAVEVDEFAFDELSSLEGAGQAQDVAGTDKPTSPDEEADE
jgi:chromatin segregation and condensation protein Rec8/ScpA/Scc1 (kleisin family)